jgi:type I restriction enzyme, S subunit
MEVKAGYKQTEVGVIPEDWEVKRLGECAKFRTGPFGSALHKSDYTDDGVPVINPMHILNGTIAPSRTMTITEDAARSLSDFRLRSGEIVIGRRGDMGRCAVVQDHQAGWLCGTGSMIIRCEKNTDAYFLQRVLSSPQAIAAIEDASVGTTMVNLNQSTLAGLKVQLPPPSEQRAIAEALSDVDGLLGGLERLIAKKRDLKQAAMQQLLTGQTRLPGFHCERLVRPTYKQTEVGVIPEDWNVRSLQDSTEATRPISYGIVQTGPYIPNGVPCLRVIDINDGHINKTELIRTSKQISNSYRRTILKAGDLVMPLRGKVGDAGIIDEELEGANLTRGVALLAIRPRLSGAYCAHFISWSATRKRLEQSMNGSALQEIPIATLRSFQIGIPPTGAEQRAIAAVLSDMDAEIAALEQRREKTRALKQAMMQELLTGKTRLV